MADTGCVARAIAKATYLMSIMMFSCCGCALVVTCSLRTPLFRVQSVTRKLKQLLKLTQCVSSLTSLSLMRSTNLTSRKISVHTYSHGITPATGKSPDGRMPQRLTRGTFVHVCGLYTFLDLDL